MASPKTTSSDIGVIAHRPGIDETGNDRASAAIKQTMRAATSPTSWRPADRAHEAFMRTSLEVFAGTWPRRGYPARRWEAAALVFGLLCLAGGLKWKAYLRALLCLASSDIHHPRDSWSL